MIKANGPVNAAVVAVALKVASIISLVMTIYYAIESWWIDSFVDIMDTVS